MARFFFDFRSGGAFALDEEGIDLLDAEAAHEQAVTALADAIRDGIMEGAMDQRFIIEVRDNIGRVLNVSAILGSEIFRKQVVGAASVLSARKGHR